MTKLRGTVDCGTVLPDTIEHKAKIGDIAVARMHNAELDQCFLVGVVTAADDGGNIKTVATARRRTAWCYDAQIHVADAKDLLGQTAEQIALKLPQAFDTFEDAHRAILNEIQAGVK